MYFLNFGVEGLTLSLPSSKSIFSQPSKEEFISEVVRIGTIIIFKFEQAMKSQVLHTVWCNITGEGTGEIWTWSLLEYPGFQRFLALGELGPKSRAAGDWWRAPPRENVLFKLRNGRAKFRDPGAGVMGLLPADACGWEIVLWQEARQEVRAPFLLHEYESPVGAWWQERGEKVTHRAATSGDS